MLAPMRIRIDEILIGEQVIAAIHPARPLLGSGRRVDSLYEA